MSIHHIINERSSRVHCIVGYSLLHSVLCMYTAHIALAHCEHSLRSTACQTHREREKVDTTSLIEILSSPIDIFDSVSHLKLFTVWMSSMRSQRWSHTLSSSTSSSHYTSSQTQLFCVPTPSILGETRPNI